MRRVVIAEGCDVAEIAGVVGSVRVIEADGRGAEVEARCGVGAVPKIQPQRRVALEEGFESGSHVAMDERGVRCEHVLALLADGLRREQELSLFPKPAMRAIAALLHNADRARSLRAVLDTFPGSWRRSVRVRPAPSSRQCTYSSPAAKRDPTRESCKLAATVLHVGVLEAA